MNNLQILRLGLFQMVAGGLSVLFLGVLNRIMRVELEIDLLIVSLLIGGGHYMGALVAIPFGHFSDTNRIYGYRRTYYIVIGMLITTTILILSPHVAIWTATDPNFTRVSIAFLFFLFEGISTFLAGTAYLALIADLTQSKNRGPAAGLVWTLLMFGIISTGIAAASFMNIYSFEKLVTLFIISAAIAIGFSTIALWKQEKPSSQEINRTSNLSEAVKTMLKSKTARRFAIFLLISMFSFFMQDVILEPFGGEVFGLSASTTTRFNSYMGIGLVSAMIIGGTYLIPRFGKRKIATIGCSIIVIGFSALAFSGFTGNSQNINEALILLGIGAGLFTIGSIALMMDLTADQHIGLYIGAWTLVQALAKGPASILSGAFQQMFVSFGFSSGQSYGSVFLIEATGVLVAIYILNGIKVDNFKKEIQPVLRTNPLRTGFE